MSTEIRTRRRMPPSQRSLRIGALILAATPLSLLALAGTLEPSSAGLGTHQQLGLPPCSMRVLLGIRCPGCGMTTSWSHFMRGQWSASMQVNVGGFLLAVYCLAFSWFALKTCFNGRLPNGITQKSLAVGLLAVAAVTLVDWTCRLAIR